MLRSTRIRSTVNGRRQEPKIKLVGKAVIGSTADFNGGSGVRQDQVAEIMASCRRRSATTHGGTLKLAPTKNRLFSGALPVIIGVGSWTTPASTDSTRARAATLTPSILDGDIRATRGVVDSSSTTTACATHHELNKSRSSLNE
jgi:hypothetical protein